MSTTRKIPTLPEALAAWRALKPWAREQNERAIINGHVIAGEVALDLLRAAAEPEATCCGRDADLIRRNGHERDCPTRAVEPESSATCPRCAGSGLGYSLEPCDHPWHAREAGQGLDAASDADG